MLVLKTKLLLETNYLESLPLRIFIGLSTENSDDKSCYNRASIWQITNINLTKHGALNYHKLRKYHPIPLRIMLIEGFYACLAGFFHQAY